MVEGIFKQVNDMEEFIEYLESKYTLLNRQIYFIIEDIARETFLSDPDMVI